MDLIPQLERPLGQSNSQSLEQGLLLLRSRHLVTWNGEDDFSISTNQVPDLVIELIGNGMTETIRRRISEQQSPICCASSQRNTKVPRNTPISMP